MLPIVVRSTEEMLKLVPQNLRDASYALGATKSRTTLTVVLPKAAPGIISGALLAIARAAGETAPLIFTIGAAKATNWNLFERHQHLAVACRSTATPRRASPPPRNERGARRSR